ncbi:MAG: hypothetical protein ACUZ77_03530 [Candidatus Brocadiales bacterium]
MEVDVGATSGRVSTAAANMDSVITATMDFATMATMDSITTVIMDSGTTAITMGTGTEIMAFIGRTIIIDPITMCHNLIIIVVSDIGHRIEDLRRREWYKSARNMEPARKIY